MNDHFADARDRIRARVVIDECGCWIWQGSTSGNGRGGGYGRLRYRGQYWAAHRLSYLAFVGPLVAGKHIDHACPKKNPPDRRCVNPGHLQQVTGLRNQRLRARRQADRASIGGAA